MLIGIELKQDMHAARVCTLLAVVAKLEMVCFCGWISSFFRELLFAAKE